MIETGGADVDGDDARRRMTEGKLCCLPRATSGNENIKIGAIFLVGPEQMILGAMDVLVLPHLTSAIEIFERRWIRVICVKLANRVCDSFRFHEFCCVFRVSGVRSIHH